MTRCAGCGCGSPRRSPAAGTSAAWRRSATTRRGSGTARDRAAPDPMTEPRPSSIQRQDPKLHAALAGEYERQRTQLELIASENYVSDAVLEAAGSVLTNKYAEGQPGKRYYGGCEWVDVAEDLARERLKQLFGADHSNVQAHSGASANLAAYLAVSEPGDTLMGMSLAHGGHLTHGHPVSLTGRLWKAVQYGVREDGRIDYDEVARLAREHRP